jgi:hypothetical protein
VCRSCEQLNTRSPASPTPRPAGAPGNATHAIPIAKQSTSASVDILHAQISEFLYMLQTSAASSGEPLKRL